MTTICKVLGVECPKELDICCGICEDRNTCDLACTRADDYKQCPDAQQVENEVIRFQSTVPEVITQITNLIRMKKSLDDQEKQLKQELVKAMERCDIKSFENDNIKMVYVAPTTRSTIDSAKLKKDHPDIAEQYTKTSAVSASVRVTLKGDS